MNPLPIVDSHVHLWHPGQFHYPWLEQLPPLNRPFLLPDFAAATQGLEVQKLIFVECGCRGVQNLAEVAWVTELSRTEPRLKGIIAAVELEKGAAVEVELETLASCGLVKGVRRNLQGETDFAFCRRAEFIHGLKQLARHRFTFDVCIRLDQLPEVAELVRVVPEVTFILDHCGKPPIRTGKREPWATDLKNLAIFPNVACKISGLATEADWQHWQPTDLEFYVSHVIACFGYDRILFGGDWPVATLATDYRRWVETLLPMFSAGGASGLTGFFQGNAERIYHV